MGAPSLWPGETSNRRWIKHNSSEDAHAQAMVASFCGRSFDDGETNEIAQRIRKATASINMEIEARMEFWAHKGAIGCIEHS